MGRVITIQYAMLRSLERRLDELIDEISALLDEGDFRSLPRNAPATAPIAHPVSGSAERKQATGTTYTAELTTTVTRPAPSCAP